MLVPGIVGRNVVAARRFNKNIAVLVAIDRYSNGVPELRTPVSDATALADILRGLHGFDVEIVTNEGATRTGLNCLLSRLAARVGNDDRVFFYFAGHGIAHQADDGPKGCILPYEADRRSVEGTALIAALRRLTLDTEQWSAP